MKDPVPRVACFTPTQAEFWGPFPLLRVASRVEQGPFLAAAGTLHGTETVLARTGMGKEHAARAAQRIFDAFTIREALLIGFGGGLRRGQKVADVVACSEVIGQLENRRIDSSRELLGRAQATGQLSVVAPAVTVDHVVRSAWQKRELRKTYGAGIVEMEGYPILAESRRRGIPSLMVRAVLDRVEEDLPEVIHLLTDCGRIRAARWLRHVVTRPSRLMFFYEMAKRAKACRAALNRFVEHYFATYREEPR